MERSPYSALTAAFGRARVPRTLLPTFDRLESGSLPPILCSPKSSVGRSHLKILQRDDRLPDLPPECRLIAAQPFECSLVEIGKTKETTRDFESARISVNCHF